MRERIDAKIESRSETLTYVIDFKPKDPGSYGICLDNRNSRFFSKIVQVNYYMPPAILNGSLLNIDSKYSHMYNIFLSVGYSHGVEAGSYRAEAGRRLQRGRGGGAHHQGEGTHQPHPQGPEQDPIAAAAGSTPTDPAQ